MRVTFHEKSRDAIMETTDWLMPPRVGDQVFLIGEAHHDFADGEPFGFQFDAVVLSVLFFGPGHAVVEVKQKSTATSESIPDPSDEEVEEPEEEPEKTYSCPVCDIKRPHTIKTLYKEIGIERKREIDADTTSFADDAAKQWRMLTKAYNKHALNASMPPLKEEKDYYDSPFYAAEMSWGDGGGSPGECSKPASVDEVTDQDCDGLNPGIIQTVKWLHANGFNTCDSGDGVTKNYDCDLGYPYVHMITHPDKLVSESKRLSDLLTANGHKVEEFNPDMDTGGPNIQASYDPISNTATLSLFNVML